MKRLLGTAALLLLMTTPNSWADPTGQSGNDWFGVSDTHKAPGRSGATADPIDVTSVTTTPSPLDVVRVTDRLACGDDNANLQVDTFVCETALMRCGSEDRGLIYYRTTHLRNGRSQAGGTGCYVPQDVASAVPPGMAAPPPRLTPAMVLRAFERVPLPESEIVVQPPGGQTLVGLDTIFSTEAEGFTETVRLLGRSVELDITPTAYRWHHGDTTEQRTDWPGQRWSRSHSRYVSHVYDDRMRVSTSVDTTWSARYRVDGGAWQDVPGTVTIEGDATPLRVRSASPRLVGVGDRR